VSLGAAATKERRLKESRRRGGPCGRAGATTRVAPTTPCQNVIFSHLRGRGKLPPPSTAYAAFSPDRPEIPPLRRLGPSTFGQVGARLVPVGLPYASNHTCPKSDAPSLSTRLVDAGPAPRARCTLPLFAAQVCASGPFTLVSN